MNKKKLISLALAACVALSATACAGGGVTNASGQSSNTADNSETSTQTEQTEQNEQDNAQEEQTGGAAALQDEITGEITVSAYETALYKSFLEEAAAAFEAAYPGTKVNVETFSAMPDVKTSESGGKKIMAISMEKDEQAEQDYINKTNTELMGGGGADVLAMDIIPYYQYAESGQLEDLKPYMDGDASFNIADYRQNVLDAMQYKTGQYIFPLDYTFNYFAYDSSLFTDEQQQTLMGGALTFERLMDIGRAPFDAANSGAAEPVYMFGANPQTMFNNLFRANYAQFVDVETKTASFNTGTFAGLLEAVNKYAEDGYIQPAGVDAKGQMSLQAFEQKNAEQYIYKLKSASTLLQHYNKGSNRMMMFGGGGSSAGNEENDEIAGNVSNDKGENAFTYGKAFGMNANAANKATAWAFIKFMAGEEIQGSMQVMNTPVNNKALAAKTKQTLLMSMAEPDKQQPVVEPDAEMDEEQLAIYDAYMAKLNELADGLNTYYVQDQIVNNAVQSEIKYFFDGSKTAEEVANVLQNKVELYLNE